MCDNGRCSFRSETKLICSGCGLVGRAVASISSSPRFESSHWQNLYLTLTVNCIEKAKINKKEAWIGPFKKNSFDYSVLVRQSNQQFYDKPILHPRPLCKNCASLCCAEGLLH